MIKLDVSKIKGTEILDQGTRMKIKAYLKRIDDNYLYLKANEAKGEKFEKLGVIQSLESLEVAFGSEDRKEALLKLARNNHPNSREILYTGGMYAMFKGDKEMAAEYYTELSKYYKQIGNDKEALKYSNIVKNL